MTTDKPTKGEKRSFRSRFKSILPAILTKFSRKQASSKKSVAESSHMEIPPANASAPIISNTDVSNTVASDTTGLTATRPADATATEVTPNDAIVPDADSTTTALNAGPSNATYAHSTADASHSSTNGNGGPSTAIATPPNAAPAPTDTVDLISEQPEALVLDAAQRDTKPSNLTSLWERARAALEEQDPKSKYVSETSDSQRFDRSGWTSFFEDLEAA